MSYLDEVDLSEGVVAPGLLDIQDGNNVFVVEVAKQLHLTQSSETEHGVIKGCDLLDGDLLARGLVDSRALNSVSISAQHLESWIPPYHTTP